MPSAFHLIRAYQAPCLVFVIQQLFAGIKCFLLIVLFGGIELILAVEHLDIAVVNQIPQYTQTGVPFEVFVNRSLDISGHTDEVAFVLIEHTRTVVLILRMVNDVLRVLGQFVGPIMPVIVIAGLITVKAVEIAHSVRQIGSIQRQAITRNEIFRVIVETENTMVFGGISRLQIERMDIFRILRTVAVVINIGQHTSLEAIVRIVGDRRQNTEVPAGLNLATKRVHFLWLGLLLGR